MKILTGYLTTSGNDSILGTQTASEEIAQMFCDEVVRIEKYGDNHLGLIVRLMLKQMGFTEQQIINSLEKLKKENVRP